VFKSDETTSVEDCLIAVSNAVGVLNILIAARMNKAVIFLRETSMVLIWLIRLV